MRAEPSVILTPKRLLTTKGPMGLTNPKAEAPSRLTVPGSRDTHKTAPEQNPSGSHRTNQPYGRPVAAVVLPGAQAVLTPHCCRILPEPFRQGKNLRKRPAALFSREAGQPTRHAGHFLAQRARLGCGFPVEQSTLQFGGQPRHCRINLGAENTEHVALVERRRPIRRDR